MTDWKRTRT